MMFCQSEAYNAALDMESKGHKYYVDIAEKASNTLTKAVFASLAEQELWHIKRIHELYERAGECIVDSHPPGTVEDAVKEVLKRFESKELDALKMDNAQAYEYAMILEREGALLYEKLAEESKTPAEAEFFMGLLAEEDKHLEALENVFFYLERTGDWFASQEDHVWNWMNM